jgi:hypothetical protein
MNRVEKFIRSPWGFNMNSRGCSAAEPVVTYPPNTPNPAGVEQGSSGILPESQGLQCEQAAPAVLPNSTLTNKRTNFIRSHKRRIARCGRRNIALDLIWVIPLQNQSTQAGCLSYLFGGGDE